MKNIREIAKISGVSTATVSRYINKTGKVSQEKSKAIQNTIDMYGYKPNKLTNVILNGESLEIGLIVQNINNPFFAQLMDEIEINSQKSGLSLIVCNAKGNKQVEAKYFDDLVSRRVSGVMVINTTDEKIYEKSPVPIVGIEKQVLHYPRIKVDNKQGVKLLFNQVLEIEKKKVLYITSEKYNYAATQRLESFENEAKKKNVNYDVLKVNDEYDDLRGEIKGLESYEIVFCWNDIVAHYVHAQIQKLKLNVPGDIEVLGFDGLDLNMLFPYELTTIRQNITELGKSSFDSLKKLIEKNNVEDVVINVELIKGETLKM